MGAALQRLLTRPSALRILRALNSSAADPFTDLATILPCHTRHCPGRKLGRRKISAVASSFGHGDCKPYKQVEDAASDSRKSWNASISEEKPGMRIILVDSSANKDLFSFNRLVYESDVNGGDSKPRLVDQSRYQHDFRFWITLLDFRERLLGSEGVADIWRGIKSRNIQLPTLGPEANVLWSAFLGLGRTDLSILFEIWEYAKRLYEDTGKRWAALYGTIMGSILITRPGSAHQWHNRLRKDHPPQPGALGALVEPACTSKKALGAFWVMYLENEQRNIYSTLIPLLCKRQQYDAAYKWHNLLIQKGDLPPSSATVEPLMHYMALYGDKEKLKELTHGMLNAGVIYANSTVKVFKDTTLISREVMNRMLGEAHGIEPKSLSDSFCARLFATKPFPVDMVLNGMTMLGGETIGPLAIQAIALRDPTIDGFLENLGKIRCSGLSLGSDRYSQSLRKAAIENKHEIFHDILHSDQHPDVFEDWKLQEAILAWALKNQLWREVNKTLAILSVFAECMPSSCHVWNLALRAHLTRRRLNLVHQTLEQMRMQNLTVSMTSVRYVFQTLLRPRRTGHRPRTSPIRGDDDLGTITKILAGVVRTGTRLPPRTWCEILKRFGMTGRLVEFEKLVLWLADWYNPSTAHKHVVRHTPFRANIHRSTAETVTTTASVPTRLPRGHPLHPLKILFPTQMLNAIIAWYILKAFTRDPRRTWKKTPPTELPIHKLWTRGLHLLKALSQRGVLVHTDSVYRTLEVRFTILYGEGRISNRRANRVARRNNPYTIQQMAQTADRIWGGRLFAYRFEPPERRRMLMRACGYEAKTIASERCA